jgi:succinylarginine dihydrolase
MSAAVPSPDVKGSPARQVQACTVNFDGLPGPTHNYSGLAHGNLAAERNAQQVSNPREAALQGLAKMRSLAARGYAQAVLPPHERPHVPTLRALGFDGSDHDVIVRAAHDAPELLAACSSAAAMWAANAATVSAAADCADGRVHVTPANLVTHAHRALEAPTTSRVLRAIFADDRRFCVHDPLPAAPQFADEGAANHTRFADDAAAAGVEFFVYGRRAFGGGTAPARFPARQTREASEAVARRHGLDPARTVFAQQRPDAIDAGVFHNDVIAVGEGTFLFCHERAFVDQPAVLDALQAAVGPQFASIVIRDDELPVAAAIGTYLFNSQLLPIDGGGFLLVAPAECRANRATAAILDRLVAGDTPIRDVLTFDLRQSMRNGGGPACLRLRVPLGPRERESIAARVFLDATLELALEAWIRRNYRDRLSSTDLGDPALLDESRRALDELTQLLGLPSVYPFQRSGS